MTHYLNNLTLALSRHGVEVSDLAQWRCGMVMTLEYEGYHRQMLVEEATGHPEDVAACVAMLMRQAVSERRVAWSN